MPVANSYLDFLNAPQREAVEHISGPVLVIAGAGSGKTRVLTYKIVHLLNQGYVPWSIMALTFTNKAAREMRERIDKMVGSEMASKLWMGTFHSVFGRLLRVFADRIGFKSDYTIYDTSDSRSLIKMIIKDLGLNDQTYKPQKVHARLSKLKNQLISPEEYLNDKNLIEQDERDGMVQMGEIFSLYCERCRVAGAMDFDDMLVFTHKLLSENDDVRAQCQRRFKYFLVDEYQDTNYVQHRIITLLAGGSGMLTVVGDDSQSIYAFRGAKIGNILNLKVDFPGLKTVKLEQNYRSTQNIIGAANSLIAHNTQGISKTCFSENETGDKVRIVKCYDDKEESFLVANLIMTLKAQHGCRYNDFAVLYRTNAQSRRLEEALRSGGLKNTHGNKRRGIPFRIYGGLSFYQRKEVKDTLSYFRLTVNPDDDEAMRRVINYPARGIGATTENKLRACAVAANTSMWNVLCNPEKFGLNVNRGTMAKLNAFAQMISGFIDLYNNGVNAYDLAKHIIDTTGLIEVLLGDKTPENESKKDNIYELIGAAKDYVEETVGQGSDRTSMRDFLMMAQLSTDQDEDPDNIGDCVTLMTVHAAKGLEFDNVIITGLEEDLFPAAQSKSTLENIEEERRLFYVAITRAAKRCIITHAGERFRNGMQLICNPSRFLGEINNQFVDIQGSLKANADRGESYGQPRRWQQHSWRDGTTKTVHRQVDAPIVERNVPSPTNYGNTPFLPPPGFKKYAPEVKPKPGATKNGAYTTHTASELKSGTTIEHDRFGKGTVLSVDTSGSDAKIIVAFNSGTKTLLLKFARFIIAN